MTDEEVKIATVRLPTMGGQGILVPGGFILTAAHCIDWDLTGMTLGDWHIEHVETATGSQFRMHPVFIEPLSDIAVLGAPDGGEPELEADYKAWLRFVSSTRPIGLANETLQSADVRFLSHEGHWISASAQYCDRRVFFESQLEIKCGTSGGPVISVPENKVMGVCSNSGGREMTAEGGGKNGSFILLSAILPPWIRVPEWEYFSDDEVSDE